MKVLAAGDSFIYGVDLADCQTKNQHSLLTWPALLADEYVCIATPGTSNDAIARAVIDYCENNHTDFVVVQWTFPWRFGMKFIEPIGWFEFDLNVKKETSASHLIENFLIEFYKVAGTTEYWPVYSTLKEIVLLQQYLKSKKIPYLFTSVYDIIFKSLTAIYDARDKHAKNLYNLIDQDSWYWWPNQEGFYQWAITNKYNVGVTQHPLEQAHADAAELIRSKFNELATQYNQ